jgi:hypothetical protein
LPIIRSPTGALFNSALFPPVPATTGTITAVSAVFPAIDKVSSDTVV